MCTFHFAKFSVSKQKSAANWISGRKFGAAQNKRKPRTRNDHASVELAVLLEAIPRAPIMLPRRPQRRVCKVKREMSSQPLHAPAAQRQSIFVFTALNAECRSRIN